MSSPQLTAYYAATANRAIRDDLRLGVEQVSGPRVAIDCGFGAGADIEFLLASGFQVFGFDIEEQTIARCRQRFGTRHDLTLTVSEFIDYPYPPASLIVADASLFFCPPQDFPLVWQNMNQALLSQGIFCGSFLGPNDTMAGLPQGESHFWDEVLVLEGDEVRALFDTYELLRFTEHRSSGLTPQGTEHNWHIFSAVARKH